jgi:hypothetical protein
MLLLIGTALGFLLAGSAFLVLRGLVGLFRRRPRSVVPLLRGIGLFVMTIILIVLASSLMAMSPPTEVADLVEQKARVLSQNISALMNLSFLGLPFGLIAGLVVEIRKRQPPKQLP